MKQSSRWLVPLFVGVGTGIGALAIMAGGASRGFVMRINPIADPGWAKGWAASLIPASVAQEVALERMLDVLTVALVITALAAAVCGALLLAVERVTASRATAIRASLGIGRWRLIRELAQEVWVSALAASGVAVAVLLLGDFGIRSTWPGQVLRWSFDNWIAALGSGVIGGLTVLFMVTLPGLAVWRQKRLYGFLSRQGTTLPERGESFGRDVAVVTQVAVAVSVLVAVGGLVGSSPDAHEVGTLGDDTIAIPMEITASAPVESWPRLYESLLGRLREHPEIQVESVATPGALVGLGVMGTVLADCGRCYIGGLYSPISVAYVEHYAVGPGFFGMFEVEVRSGREFMPTDARDGERVAVVNRSFAEGHFENGDPLGRWVLIGGMIRGEWFEVIGVVDAFPATALGANPSRAPAIYLPVLQVPPARANILIRPDAASGPDFVELAALVPPGVTLGLPRTVTSERRRSWAPLAWLQRALLLVMIVALAVVVTGVGSVMWAMTEQSQGEIGLRMAMGASPPRIRMLMFRRAYERFRWGAGIGLLTGLLLVGLLQRVIPEVSPPTVQWIVSWTVLLVILTGIGAFGPARSASRLHPAQVLLRG